jgi:hypothetical protein
MFIKERMVNVEGRSRRAVSIQQGRKKTNYRLGSRDSLIAMMNHQNLSLN